MTAPASPASAAQQLFVDFEAEMASTRRILERVPDGKFDWKPHEKSMSLGRLAGHVAELPDFARQILAHDEFDFSKGQYVAVQAKTTAELLAAFDEKSAALRETIADTDAEALAGTWTLRSGAHVIVSGPRAKLARTAGFNHILHHRAQLAVYLRLLDVPVPGLYGPSADEQ